MYVTGRVSLLRLHVMNVALRRPMSVDEFLAWERQQELRWEFDGLHPVAMTGGTVEHSVIATNLVRALEDRLKGKPCRAFRGDLKIMVAGRVRYPDAVVTCSPVPRGTDLVPDPVVVFEVLSASTATTDRIAKNEEYRLIYANIAGRTSAPRPRSPPPSGSSPASAAAR